MFSPTRILALFALLPAILMDLASAHLPIDTNVNIDIEMDGNLLTVEPWVPTFLLPPLQDLTFENEPDWPRPEDRRQAIEDYFDKTCPIVIDGVQVKPQMKKLRLQPMEQGKHLGEVLDFVEARILLHYQVESPPQKVKFRWGIYPPEPEEGWGELVEADQDPQEFDLMMFIDKKEDFVFFSPEEPEFFWHRKPAKVERINVISPEELAAAENAGSGAEVVGAAKRFPWASALAGLAGVVFFVVATITKLRLPLRFVGLLVAAGLAFSLRPGNEVGAAQVSAGVGEERAVEIFRALQANLYKAFDYETEDQVYEVLAQSVDGALLDDIYTEVYRSLLVVEKSAAVCKVREVDVLSCEAKAVDPSADGKAVRFDLSCHWRVHGLVEHFEHIHRRVNEYQADYRLTLKESGWKITAVAVNQQDRLDPKTLKPSVDYGAGG